MPLASGGKRAALSARGHDCYESPPEAVHALLEHESLPQHIWEPACGPGAIVKVLRAAGHIVKASDLKDYGCPDSEVRIDFLMEHAVPSETTTIVTNPPYMIANAFTWHALRLVPRVYMLLPLSFLEGGQRDWRRDRLLEDGHLARVLLFRERLPMMHRHGWEGPHATSSRAYAWFCWDRAYRGPIITKRISWHPLQGGSPKAKAA
jgi:hypothetical protein